jgi:hypothetical protein
MLICLELSCCRSRLFGHYCERRIGWGLFSLGGLSSHHCYPCIKIDLGSAIWIEIASWSGGDLLLFEVNKESSVVCFAV